MYHFFIMFVLRKFRLAGLVAVFLVLPLAAAAAEQSPAQATHQAASKITSPAKAKEDQKKKDFAKLFFDMIGKQPTDKELAALIYKYGTTAAAKKVLNTSVARKSLITNTYHDQLCRPPRTDELEFFIKRATSLQKIGSFLSTHPQNCVGEKPVAVAPKELEVGAQTVEVLLDGSASFDPSTAPLTYKWEILKGTPSGGILSNEFLPQAQLLLPKDTKFADYYAQPGIYKVKLTVSNQLKYSSTAEVVVTVSPYTFSEKQMLGMVNSLRESLELPKLTLEERLTAAARKYSYYMRAEDWFEHKDKEDKNFDHRIKQESYPFAVVGENILMVKSNRDDLGNNDESMTFFFEGWKNSPNHYENMVNQDFKEVGIGFSVGPSPDPEFPFAHYGSQEFGRPNLRSKAKPDVIYVIKTPGN